MKKLNVALAALAVAAVFFSAGYFTGRAVGGDVNVTVNESVPENEKTERKVNINRAEKDELMTLPGIGETLAGRIIDYRNVKGGFFSTEELKLVQGITDAVFDKLKDQITIEVK